MEKVKLCTIPNQRLRMVWLLITMHVDPGRLSCLTSLFEGQSCT